MHLKQLPNLLVHTILLSIWTAARYLGDLGGGHLLLKVRSHRTRMKRYAWMIYMLSQCKDAIDNPAALFARMRRREWCDSLRIERLTRELKNLNFGGYSRRVNQSGACSSSDVITSGGRKSQTTMEDCYVVNFTHEWSECHARMKRVNSKCSSVQLRANSAIYSLHSRLVWTHLYFYQQTCPQWFDPIWISRD